MEDQIRTSMIGCGIDPPDQITMDGSIHRFGKDKSCWYVFFNDGVAAGTFGDWRDGVTHNWCVKLDRKITPEEQEINRKRIEEAKIKRDEERERAQEEAKHKAKKIWESLNVAIDHPYLTKKNIKPCGARINGDSLVIPLWNDSGDICSLQFIDADGNKKFLPNGQVKGCYFRIGKPNGNVCIAEGFATAASIHEATGYAVIVAFNAGKLVDAAILVRKRLPKSNIIICADVDKNGIGLEKANLAADAVDGGVVYPEGLPEGMSDFNDLAALKGLNAVRDIIIKTPSTLNDILDSDIKYSNVDLLKYVEDNHVLKKLSLYISEKTSLPPSTVFLCGLGVFSAISCRKYSVSYQDKEKLPIGLYVVTEQPSGTGKSRCLKTFQKPFYEMSEKIHDSIMVEYNELTKNDNLDDDEKLKLAELDHKLRSLGTLFTTNATAEGLEKGLTESNGFFSAVSSEQGLFNVLFGGSYKSDSRANNNDVALNGFDGGFINSSRVTRKGYCGHVVGGIVCFAQSGSIETLLNSSNGTGLSERFLMLAEPHSLGVRDHLKESEIVDYYYQEYASKCEALESILNSQYKFSETIEIYISDNGFRMIREYLNGVEPHLVDGGKYSHASLRGAASKIDMQVMKIACNLSLLDQKIDFWSGMDDKYIEAAINISDSLLQANLKLCQDKGVIGSRAEFEAILRLFEDNPKPRLERAIIQSRSKVSPFKEFSGNRSTHIRNVLSEMVDQNILSRNELGGITSYKAI